MVTDRVRDWAQATAQRLEPPVAVDTGLGLLTIGLDARGPLDEPVAEALAVLGGWVVDAGGSIVLGSRSALVRSTVFRTTAWGAVDQPEPTLAHGQRPESPGWHVMRMPGTDWMEAATGFAAAGAHLVLAHVAGGSLSATRLVPLVQVSADPATVAERGGDLDAVVTGTPAEMAAAAADMMVAVASRRVTSRAEATGDVGFQVTRGLLGVSM